MPDREIYEYAIIRLVPKVEREEFLNIGVIVFSKRKDFLEMRYELDAHRIQSFNTQIDLAELRCFLEGWLQICRGQKGSGPIGKLSKPERFRWLTATRSTIIQFSSVHPGRTDNPEQLVDKLFDRFVA